MSEIITNQSPKETVDRKASSVIEEKIVSFNEKLKNLCEKTDAICTLLENKIEERDIDECMELIITIVEHAPDRKVALDAVMQAFRPSIREMEPEDRRQCCADMEAAFSPLYGNKTGRYFNVITSAYRPKEPDYKDLGRKIMEKRNPNYSPKA